MLLILLLQNLSGQHLYQYSDAEWLQTNNRESVFLHLQDN